MINVIFIIFILFNDLYSQEIYVDYLIADNDTVDVFSYQIPDQYNENISHPLLLTFHQWGGNENSNYYTEFDEEANNRNWIMLSPFGGSSNNYNHQGMQQMIESEIIWMMENFNIDKNKIYMVGGSMGGAAGAIYANNHLNPEKPMVAATASASGILDCERRAIEMDGNNSMIEWFGGEWYEVPFEYHRNSAIYFEDSTQSMHYNLKYTPLYLDFGVTEPHRTHAEEFYEILTGYNENIWIDSAPTGSHGYSVFDENHVCEWLSQFSLIQNPDTINVNLDEPSRAYWLEAHNQFDEQNFIRINAMKFYNYNDNSTWEGHAIFINEYTNSDSLIVHTLNEEYVINNNIDFHIVGNSNNIGFAGPLFNGDNSININAININEEFSCQYFNFNINNNIIWVERRDESGNICTSNNPYKINFDFSNNQLNIGDECILSNNEIGFYDCEMCCWEFEILDWLGDGYCDYLGGCGWEGPLLDCPQLGFDCGDCNSEWDGDISLEICNDINIIPGDINNDSIVNIIDVVILVNYILGQNNLTETQILLSDINQDEIVNILDIIQIVNIIMSN